MLLCLAILIAWPVAWYVMNRWLENFAYRIEIGWMTFLLGGVIALAIAALTVELPGGEGGHGQSGGCFAVRVKYFSWSISNGQSMLLNIRWNECQCLGTILKSLCATSCGTRSIRRSISWVWRSAWPLALSSCCGCAFTFRSTISIPMRTGYTSCMKK